MTAMLMYELGVVELAESLDGRKEEIKQDHVWADGSHFIFYTHDVRARYRP